MSCHNDGPRTASDCTPCSPGIRNRYFRGKLLTIADYEAEQNYAIQRRRLVNRQMLGWGVVSGFEIRPDKGETQGTLEIGEGFAFDRRGRELVACETVRLRDPDDLIWLVRGGGDRLKPGKPPAQQVPAAPGADEANTRPAPVEAPARGPKPGDQGTHYLLRAHYAERRVDRVVIKEGCGDPVCEANHICETVVYSLTAMADCPPGLASCPASRWPAGMDGTDIEIGDIGKWGDFAQHARPALAALGDRGPHATLARWSLANSGKGETCCEPTLYKCRDGFAFDPDNGVPLACVTIAYECDKPYVAAVVDAVAPRRLARPNDVLFDLIRGCDLTRIKDVGWREFLGAADEPVKFRRYQEMFVGGRSQATPPPVETRFWVLFSGPVQVASLSQHVITITLLHWDTEDAVRLMRRLPIVGIKVAPRRRGDPPGTTRAFLPVVHGNYWLEEIRSTSNAYDEKEGTIVEIGVRGGMIVDAAGQLVAAGGGYLETRPGWPGGEFISAFTVAAPVASPSQPTPRKRR